MLGIRYYSSLLLILLGTLDCLTTVVGTLYFDTKELNPLIAGLVATNLPGFVAVKLAVTILVGVTFILVEKMLRKNPDKKDRSYQAARNTLKAAYVGLTGFLTIVVANNVLVLLQIA